MSSVPLCILMAHLAPWVMCFIIPCDSPRVPQYNDLSLQSASSVFRYHFTAWLLHSTFVISQLYDETPVTTLW